MFGGFASVPWRAGSSELRYYGTGESFLYTFDPLFTEYKWQRT